MDCWVKFKAASEEECVQKITFSMLERIIEMVKGRKDEIFVAFLDMEIAYHRVIRNQLFEVIIRCYGVHKNYVRLMEIIYNGSMVKIELENVTTGLCKSDS